MDARRDTPVMPRSRRVLVRRSAFYDVSGVPVSGLSVGLNGE